MKYIFLIVIALAIIYPADTFSQITRQTLSNSELQFAVCTVKFQNKNKSISVQYGCGLILDGKYVATCYHLTTEKGAKMLSMFILYNIHTDKDNTIFYDTAYVDLKYKSKPPQYDFSKHTWMMGERNKDFIILKLQKDIPSHKLDFYTGELKLNEEFYLLGVSIEGKDSGSLALTKAKYVFDLKFLNDTSANILGFSGDIHFGFSGSPVFNLNGQIVGIIQSGYNYLKNLPPEIRHSAMFPNIEDIYKQKHRIGLALKIDYILEHYMKDYLESPPAPLKGGTSPETGPPGPPKGGTSSETLFKLDTP